MLKNSFNRPCTSAYGQGMQGQQVPGAYGTGVQWPQMQQAMPQLPSGVPSGPSYTGLPLPVSPPGEPPITTITNINYLPGYLKTQIGKRIRVEFLIGTNMFLDKVGILMSVGASYIILRDENTGVQTVADLYSIKFVDVYH